MSKMPSQIKKCTKSKHRTITRGYLHELSYEVEKIIGYARRSRRITKKRSKTAESHNGTFRRVYHYDELSLTGIKNIQGLMFRIAAAYNTIRICNIMVENQWNLYEIIDMIRLIGLNRFEL